MAMPISIRDRSVWTVGDLERLPDDGNRYEVLHGELLVTPLPSAGHQGVAARLFVNLAIWCRANTGWRYLLPGGVYISETTWLEPDIAIYPAPEYLNQDWREMPPPVLVVEVLSKPTAKRDRHRKRPAYLGHGVAEMWIVSEAARTIERWTAASEFPVTFRDEISWTPDAAHPTFVIKAEQLFGTATS